MKPKQEIKSIPLEAGIKKNQNINKPTQKPKKLKNNFKPDHHYTSNNKNDKMFNNNTFNNKNEHNNKNINKVVDANASIKNGRNTSAPHLKDKKNKNNKVTKNNNDYNTGFSPNKFNYNSKDNVSFDKLKNHNKPKRTYNFNKNTNVNHQINNIKQNNNSKTNKKYYNNDLYSQNNKEPLYKINLMNNTYVRVRKDNYYNNTPDITKYKQRNPIIKSNNLSAFRGIQERIEFLRKQIKDKKSNEIGLIGQRLKNNKQKNRTRNTNNQSFGKSSNMNNTINYNPVTKMNIGTIENENDNEENGDNMEGNYNSDYADATPSKNEKDENNFNSIDASSSKFVSSNTKDKDYSKKDYNKKNLDVSGHSYNKTNDFVKKINTGTENNKFLFNKFAMYNSNRINTEKNKKKIKI